MPFKNRIRLPFELKKAQFPEERNSFRKADGSTKTLSVVIRKTYEGRTDFLPEIIHQRFKIALAHDSVRVEGERYLGDISQDGEYTINWQDFLDYPTAPAEFKVQVTPFDATNSNCQTCEEATQLSLVDDQAGIYTTLNENTDYTVNTSDNDTICCFPAVFSLVSFNSDYLDSASINPATGVMSIHTGTGLIDANGVLIATYRVTCPNGSYDEANVYADINGSIAGCLAPTNLVVVVQDPTVLQFSWTMPGGETNFYWELYEGTLPVGSPVQTGTVSGSGEATLSGLTADTGYYFQVRTVCYGSNSNFVGIATKTISAVISCGQYEVVNDALNFGGFRTVDYLDCAGHTQHVVVFYQSRVYICALEDSPGTPSAINPGPMTVNYIGPC